MKKLFLIGVTLSFLSCGGGEECYTCRKDSYFNGVSQTEPGPWAWHCKNDGETDDAYEARIKDLTTKGFSCQKKKR